MSTRQRSTLVLAMLLTLCQLAHAQPLRASGSDIDTPAGAYVRSERRPDGGYARLTQAGLSLRAGERYTFSMTLLGGLRFGRFDHVPNLEATFEIDGVMFEIDGTNHRYVDYPEVTVLTADIDVTADGSYTLRLPIWTRQSTTFTNVSLTDRTGTELLMNGDFSKGLAYWASDSYDRTTWFPNVDAARTPPPPFPQPTIDTSAPLWCLTTSLDGLAFEPSALDGQSVEYTRFDGEVETLVVVEGYRVTLLVSTVPAFETDEVREIACRLSIAWDTYERLTNARPFVIPHSVETPTGSVVIERPTIATVGSTCGGACGYVGATGIELGDGVWQTTLDHYRQGRESSAVPEYEMGRNFWMYDAWLHSPLEDDTPYHLAVSFANVMGHLAGVASGNPTTPGNENVDWLDTHREAFYWYQRHPDLDVLLRGGILAQKVQGGLLLHLHDTYGDGFLPAFFSAVRQQQPATDLRDAMTNYVVAASIAAGTNLHDWFRDTLDFPELPAAALRLE